MPGLVTGEGVTPIINQPWEDVADDVTGAIEKAIQPLIRKATDNIYVGLLDATQDYLKDNLAFNIASRIDAAERQADQDRQENVRLREALVWYADQAAGCRLIHSGGDVFRAALDADGGKRAYAALSAQVPA